MLEEAYEATRKAVDAAMKAGIKEEQFCNMVHELYRCYYQKKIEASGIGKMSKEKLVQELENKLFRNFKEGDLVVEVIYQIAQRPEILDKQGCIPKELANELKMQLEDMETKLFWELQRVDTKVETQDIWKKLYDIIDEVLF